MSFNISFVAGKRVEIISIYKKLISNDSYPFSYQKARLNIYILRIQRFVQIYFTPYHLSRLVNLAAQLKFKPLPYQSPSCSDFWALLHIFLITRSFPSQVWMHKRQIIHVHKTNEIYYFPFIIIIIIYLTIHKFGTL